MTRLRVAVVVQRYGLEVNGGAELHARQFVSVLRRQHDVTVLTSRAIDYTLWGCHYPAGEDDVDGVRVLRFDHPACSPSDRARVPRLHVLRYRLRGWLSRWQVPGVARANGDREHDGEHYLEAQGPRCDDLVSHLANSSALYDVAIFFTARYFPTAAGLRACPLPAVLVPTLHDERSMYLPLFHAVFRRADWILWNSTAEQRLATKLYGADVANGEVCGAAIALSQPLPPPEAIAALMGRLAIDAPYFVFVGRVTRSKGFHVLARAFKALRRQRSPRCQLVVIGQSFMADLPQHPDIVYAGFVSEAERDALVSRAVASVVTSRRESLSLVTLESMALGTPVIVNGESDVLRDHVQQSGAGWAYGLRAPLKETLRAALSQAPDRRLAMGDMGRSYVRSRYAPERVEATLMDTVARVARHRAQDGRPEVTP